MGKSSITSETAFAHPAEAVFDFVTDPFNLGKPYKGSSEMHSKRHKDPALPLKSGDGWTERVELLPDTYLSTWKLITVHRPRKFVFQQNNNFGQKENGTGWPSGFTTIFIRLNRMRGKA